VVSAGAVGVILLGAAPMAAAQASRTADPILAESIAGPSGPLNYPAPPFRLTGQHGRPVSLASLRGKVVLLTFLDPACTTGCAVAQEFRGTGQLLGANSRDVELVAIALSPGYRSAAVIGAFNRRERLDTVPNWLFLTGALPQLQRVWQAYSVTARRTSSTAAGASGECSTPTPDRARPRPGRRSPACSPVPPSKRCGHRDVIQAADAAAPAAQQALRPA
jgi:cytochrome oxidase Cu insertion factor (SCO1/SenC/PrrC family)